MAKKEFLEKQAPKGKENPAHNDFAGLSGDFSSKISGLSSKIFGVIKFILAIILLPLVYSSVVSFINEFTQMDKGLASWLFWLKFFKRNDLKYWAVFLEKFAMPTVVGEYPAGTSKKEQDDLLEAAYAVQADAAVKVRQGMVLRLLEAARSGTLDYSTLYDKMNEAISKVILSQTMTTDNGSSRSQAEVHQGVADAVVKADADLVYSSFNTMFIRNLCDYNSDNFPGASYPQVWRRLANEPDMKPVAEKDKIIFDMGYEPTEQYIQETYGDGWTKKTAPDPVLPVGRQDQLVDATQTVDVKALPPGETVSFAEMDMSPDTVDIYTARLRQQAGQVTRKWINQIENLLDECSDLAEFSERIIELYPEMNGDRMLAIMSEAMQAARLAGIYEAQIRR